MTDVLTAIYEGHLHAPHHAARRYSRPSFLMPTPFVARHLAADAKGDAAAQLAEPEASSSQPKFRWRGRRHPRSVVPKFLVTFARAVNPF